MVGLGQRAHRGADGGSHVDSIEEVTDAQPHGYLSGQAYLFDVPPQGRVPEPNPEEELPESDPANSLRSIIAQFGSAAQSDNRLDSNYNGLIDTVDLLAAVNSILTAPQSTQ